MGVRRSLSIAATLFLLAFALVSAPATIAGGPPDHAVPPLRSDGPVVLPNGKVLPVAPAGTQGPSQMAAALAAHAHDVLGFTPGAKPTALDAASGTLSMAASQGVTSTSLIPLAPVNGGATASLAALLPNGLKKEVFGFLPYWMLSATDLQWMRYDYVSTIAYFGVAAQSDGTLSTSGSGLSGWNSSAMTNVINAAHSKGDKVVLTITMMAWDSTSAARQATLLGSATYRAALVTNIVAAVKNRNADGVNLDFEPLSTTLRDQYTSFVKQLKAGLVAAGAGSYLSVCTMAGAATWSTGYDVGGLTAAGAADTIFVMGYDYSWSGSSRAGGVAPMSSSYMLDVNESVNDYLSETSGSKLIWGVPYYGRTWYTTSNALNATTVSGASGQSKAYYYTGAASLAAKYGRKWDSLGQVPWFAYKDSTGQWIEGYYDDATSLGAKYDMINQRGLAGVGIWHLLMDQGVNELWNLLANKFQNDTVPPYGGIVTLPPVSAALPIPVRWRATDAGSGVASYTVQVRDRASSGWTTWLSNTTATSANYPGTDGHAYEFRVSAKDKAGNAQPWPPAMADPGGSLTVGGFASVAVSLLNIRDGAGTGFSQITQLAQGDHVALLSGPIASGGYDWYQVQFDFSEWPSADYPRTGWAAAANGTTAYLVPVAAPTVTRVVAVTPFTDIGGSIFVNDILWLYDAGITTGCSATTFCPDDPVTRGQMAAFLDRALSLPTTSTDYFTDDEGSLFETDINRLAAAGITTGCTPTTFCPNADVTRGQMAAFLDRALTLPPTSTDYFTDDEGSLFETDINRLAAAGITTGCTRDRLLPDPARHAAARWRPSCTGRWADPTTLRPPRVVSTHVQCSAMASPAAARRIDGRAPNQLRPVKIVPDYLKFAEGSVLIRVGDTRVICAATIEDRVPPFLRGKGTGWITAEYSMLPRAGTERSQREASKGKIGGRTHEIQRLIGRSLRTVVDLTRLGERTITLDCDVIQADGGTRTASITGAYVALARAMNRYGMAHLLAGQVAAVSIGLVGGQILLDLNYAEDSTAEVDMNVVMMDDDRFVELQGTGEQKAFSREQMNQMVDLAAAGIRQLFALQRQAIEAPATE